MNIVVIIFHEVENKIDIPYDSTGGELLGYRIAMLRHSFSCVKDNSDGYSSVKEENWIKFPRKIYTVNVRRQNLH
jgi:hypothetical protein